MTENKRKNKEPKVLWKVVHKYTRESIVIGRHDTCASVMEKFKLRYEPGTVVRAKRGSFGCFCFTAEEAAKQFYPDKSQSMVIRVRPIGTKKPTPPAVPQVSNFDLPEVIMMTKGILKGSYGFKTWPVPSYTVCYTAVEVLD